MMQLKRCLIAVAILSFLGPNVWAEAFRVTGIFGQANGPFAALVESPAGSYHVVRAGAKVGGGRVVEVVRSGIRFERDGKVILVRLSGVAPEGQAEGAGATVSVEVPGRRQAAAELRRVERSLGNDAEDAQSAVATALRLPQGAIVTAVNEEPTASPQEVLRQVYTALEREAIPALTLEGVDGITRVYVIPADAGAPADSEHSPENAD